MSYAHRTMIVSTAQTPMAQSLCEGLAGPAGAGMFATGLSASGNPPATHTISAGPIGADFASLLPLTTVTRDAQGAETVTTAPGNPAAIVYLAGEAGQTVTLAQVNDLLDAIDVSEQPPFTAMARLGLQMVRVPL